MSIKLYLSALSSAQSGSYTSEIQSAASGLNPDILKAALDSILSGDDNASVEGPLADALKGGFEFAVKLVLALESEPGVDEKLDVRPSV